MRSQRADVPAPPGSRRARREADLAARGRRPAPGRWFVRSGLLAALAGLTIALPLTDGVPSGPVAPVAPVAQAAEATAAVDLPGTVEALTSVPVDTTPPPSIASTGPAVDRSAFAAASRSTERVPLPGCDGTTRPTGANGELDPADLCLLWDGGERLRADAATALAELNLAYRARFGRDLCVTDGYRSLTEQHVVKRLKGGLAAVPGRSNHGWGLAIDLCSSDTRGDSWDWLVQNGVVYGWANPAWAQRSGSGPFEPWHWEYTRGVLADGEHHSS